MQKELSIIIATVFSQRRLENLQAILTSCLLELREMDFEIIIVNNGKIQLDEKELSEFSGEIGAGKIILINEDRPDLSVARNIGIKNAQSPHIFFLDDDIEIEKGYFHALLSVLKDNTDCLCVGGKVAVKEISEIGRFSDPFYYRFLSPPSFPDTLTKIAPPFYIAGASMAFKKEAFEKFGMFNEKLGRKKGTLLSNEDSDMVMRIPLENTYIEPKAVVITSIDINKLSNTYFIRRFFWQGVSDGIMLSETHIKKYYDMQELSIKKGLLKILFKEFITTQWIKLLCSMARYIGFSFHSLFAKIYL